MATRRTQPYRRGRPRKPGGALTNMMRGATLHGAHPKDAERAAQRQARRPRKRRRRRGRSTTVRTRG